MRQFMIVFSLLSMIVFGYGSTATAQQLVGHPLPSGLIFNSDHDLFYVDPDTLAMEILVEFDTPRDVGEIVWSPDGTYFALTEYSSGFKGFSIYHFRGEVVRRIPVHFAPLARAIAWNSNGEHISLLLKIGDDQFQIGFVDVTSGELTTTHLLPLTDEDLMRIFWSPSGRFLAYQTDPPIMPDHTDPALTSYRLYLLDTNDGEVRLLTDQSQIGCVAWSNYGERLGIVSDRWLSAEEDRLVSTGLTIFDIQGNVLEIIQPSYEGQSVFDCPFAWSHDDTQVAFYSDYNLFGGYSGGIFTVTLGEDDASRIIGRPHMWHMFSSIEWSPDDTHLVVETSYGGGFNDVRVLSLDGWERHYLMEGIPLENPVWQPQGD